MLPADPALRFSRALSLLVLAWLLFLSWTYYLERTACFDSAWFSWLMIDSGGEPQSFLGRYGSWIAQLVPVALIRSHVDLVTVLRSYSVCLVLVHLVVLAIIIYRLRDAGGALALPLALVCGLHLMFYYGTSELNQGLSLTVLVWVLMRRTMDASDRRSRYTWGLVTLLVNVWTSFYHQVLLLPLVFAAGMELLDRGRWRSSWPWIVSAVLVAWYIVRIKLLATSSYEQERMPGLSDVLAQLPHLRELPSTKYLWEVYPKFKGFWALLLVTVVLMLAMKRHLLAVWTMVFCTGLLVLILITDRAAGSPTMFENFYPLGALCWAMAAGSMLREGCERYPRLVPVSFALVALVGCVQVFRGHFTVTEKVAHADRLAGWIRARGIQKGYLEDACYPWNYAYSTWQLPFETALISATKGARRTATVFCAPHRAEVDTALHRDLVFLGPDWMPLWFTSDHLNPDYFQVDPGGYTRLNTEMPDSAFAVFPWSAVKLLPPVADVRMVPGRFTVVPVGVRNLSDRLLGCLTAQGEPLRFRYTIHTEDGQLFMESGLRSALECDVPAGGEYPQGVIIERPTRKGRYRVELRLAVEDASRMSAPSASFWILVQR